MINLETPKKFQGLIDQAEMMAVEFLRPLSRKYDRAEHEYPKELDTLQALIDGMNSGSDAGVGASGLGKKSGGEKQAAGNRNGGNISGALATEKTAYGDVGLLLTIPGQGLGNAAIAAVANDEQLKKFGSKWAAMAITEPDVGSDSAAIKTTAVKDGDDYILNGTKIFVTSGERCDCVVVWASLDLEIGRPAIKSFIVERDNPGLKLIRLEHKLGIRASDTAQFSLEDCRVPAGNLLGSPEIDTKKGFAGVMETFDNTRPLVAAMATGVAQAAIDELRSLLSKAGIEVDYDRPAYTQHAAAAELLKMESDLESARLLMLESCWMADNKVPNSVNASMGKAKAGRSGTEITLKAVELAGSLGYSENSLLEKWARDSKILDIFEGTQQIQQLIIARRLLGMSSAELK